MPIKVTRRASEIEYAIRDVIVHTKDLIRNGKKIYYLNIGDPAAFDFKTPSSLKEALCRAIAKEDNYYSPSEGLPELRQAVANKEKKVNNVDITADDVLVTEGISEGIEMLMGAIVERGDEILFPGPTYPPYSSYTSFFDGTPRSYETVEAEGWQPNIDDLRSKITERTRAVVIINPNNPTGAVYDRKTIKGILEKCFGYEHGEIRVSVPGCLDFLVDDFLDFLPHCVGVGADNHAALHRRVVG